MRVREFWRVRLFGVNAAIPAILLALIVCVPLLLVPQHFRYELHALQLLVIASIYIGFAVNDGRPREISVEVAAFVGFFVVVLLGIWVNPYWVVVGYAAHALWDTFHHGNGIQTEVVRWYPPVCVIYDLFFAVVLLVDLTVL